MTGTSQRFSIVVELIEIRNIQWRHCLLKPLIHVTLPNQMQLADFQLEGGGEVIRRFDMSQSIAPKQNRSKDRIQKILLQ